MTILRVPVSHPDGNTLRPVTVSGRIITLHGIRFFAHKDINGYPGEFTWGATEYSTGLALSHGRTRKDAILSAMEVIRARRHEIETIRDTRVKTMGAVNP